MNSTVAAMFRIKQQSVEGFAELLNLRYQYMDKNNKQKKTDIRRCPFFGMTGVLT